MRVDEARVGARVTWADDEAALTAGRIVCVDGDVAEVYWDGGSQSLLWLADLRLLPDEAPS